ncbi:SLC13 family permease [Poseidonibacter ostreae]|jgi:di/tricarboxylate transporter|uniref:SLC13 family permease n=1 Tax=Poseidonibacter ostreae TaxID=2654171 RepID=A0A6L4WNK9_9BACT|nr:SLC13 family permease [Poseidonibacter ostreae]KAB7884748.1 SLC13 family permease [Poseidonibacter ostreae]KAB7888217.1 SLC13 family permease [Poseidonibacter ostreae]KAB7890979.1 SLC13 family permease [Poseidonibacter ostreae]
MQLVTSVNSHSIAVMLLTVLALFLFTREKIPLETSSLFIIVALTVGFTIFPYEYENKELHSIDFFSGFGHEALIAVCALMIAGQGLVRTGALEPVGRVLSKLWASSPKLSLLLTLIVGATLSAFVNNVPIVILLLPILTAVSIKTKTSASKVLMPMGFATLIGGMSTTIGTSTNLLVVSVAVDMGMRDFGMFDFIFPVLIAGSFAIVYLWLVVPYFIKERRAPLMDTSPRVFTAKLMITEESASKDQALNELILKTDGMMKVLRIHRNSNDMYVLPNSKTIIKAEDMLVVEDTPENLKSYEKILDAVLYSSLGAVDEEHPLLEEEQQIAEVIISQGSKLNNTTLSQSRFLQRHNLIALALHRSGKKTETVLKDIAEISLKIGDVLLIQGKNEHILELKQSRELLVLDATSDLTHTKQAPIAFFIMFGIVAVAALGILPIAISATLGVFLMFLTSCINWKDASNALNTQVILIVVASLALGGALLKTGAASYIAHLFVLSMDGMSTTFMLSGLMLLMAIMTNVVSNNAAAVIGTPIAIGIAQQLNLDPEPFVLAVLFGANMSYATPMAYKTNLLVMTAGGYTFGDFLKVGIPLTFIMWITFSWLLPLLYNI